MSSTGHAPPEVPLSTTVGTVLLVAGDALRTGRMTRALADAGLLPLLAFDVSQARRAGGSGAAQAAIVDLPVPDDELVAFLADTCRMTTIVLAGDRPEEAARALRAGAVTVLSRRHEPAVIAAQTASLLGLADPMEELRVVEHLEHGRLRLDVAAHRVWVDEIEVSLTSAQQRLLVVLARAGGRVVSHAELYRALWDREPRDGGDRLAALVHRLRKRLPDGPPIIVSIRGEGLRLAD